MINISFYYHFFYFQIEGSVQCLVNMLVATHAIMQNEAIVSLSILSVSCLSENSSIDGDAEKLQSISVKDDKDGEISDSELKNKFEQEMVKADIGKNVSLLVESNIIKIQAELLENVVKLLNILCKFPMICTHLNVSNIHTALDKLLAGRSDLQEELIKSIKKVTVDIQEASKVA